MNSTTYTDKTLSLTPASRKIIDEKATEFPHSGIYAQPTVNGSYLCRRCGIALFRASSQFNAGCGWPSFDDHIIQAVKQLPDSDGQRTEICCERCDAHLGHVFYGEHMTNKNTRHCVNSAALDLVNDNLVRDTEEAIIAGGCFWGIDHFMRLLPGVMKVEVGYIGGSINEPSYEQVCQGNTGHYEAVRVVYDCTKTAYQAVIKYFFEIHDPTQHLGQGPDMGQQYQSAIFYHNSAQHAIAQSLIEILQARGYDVVTQLVPMQPFWAAEEYHQAYYQKNAKAPYCHRPVARFD